MRWKARRQLLFIYGYLIFMRADNIRPYVPSRISRTVGAIHESPAFPEASPQGEGHFRANGKINSVILSAAKNPFHVPRPKQEGVIKGETRRFPLEIASRLCRGNRAILRGSCRHKPTDEVESRGNCFSFMDI
jgi:hypothetical protein